MTLSRGLRRLTLLACASCLAWATACSPSETDAGSDANPTEARDVAEVTDTANVGDTTDGVNPDVSPDADAHLLHQFGQYTLEAGEEVTPCVQWTLDNQKPLYVNSVTLANGGGYHHSNWYVVPEGYAEGPDGYFNCEDRNFEEFAAALRGTVLFAQSTQARSEVQQFPPGAVLKVPPEHKVVADLHFLNTTTRQLETRSRMTLGLTHPRRVETVLRPFQLVYTDLAIPPNTESTFTGECNMAQGYPGEFDIELYYVLPHYHGLGNYFGLEFFGGERDGEKIFELTGFNAEANGQSFNPPIDLTGSKGLRFTCGYDNPRDETVGWGIGDQEMCVMLGFADSERLFEASVRDGNEVVGEENGVVKNRGPCNVLPLEPADSQGMPTEEEKESDLYVPDSGQTGEDLEPIPECEEYTTPAEPLRPPTLSNLHRDVFSVGCAYSACHDAEGAAAGLNLMADDLHQELMTHDLGTPTDLPLVDPGDPQGSWLYRVTSQCKPESNAGPVAHMPRNSPTLLDKRVLAMIREWIARGARDN